MRGRGRDGKMRWPRSSLQARRMKGLANTRAPLHGLRITISSTQVFLEYDGQILAQMDRIAHIPGVIVQGRYDMICPPESAYSIAERGQNPSLRWCAMLATLCRDRDQRGAGPRDGSDCSDMSRKPLDRRALFSSGAAAALLAAAGVSAGPLPQRGGKLRLALSGAARS